MDRTVTESRTILSIRKPITVSVVTTSCDFGIQTFKGPVIDGPTPPWRWANGAVFTKRQWFVVL